MPQDAAPGFVRFEYVSDFGLHVALLPTRQWQQSAGPLGEFLRWVDDAAVDAQVMVESMAAVMADLMFTAASITNITIFTKAVGQDPVPVASEGVSIAGTEISTSWRAAVQFTVFARDTAFNPAKLVLLDVPSGNNFNKFVSLASLPLVEDLFTEWTSVNRAWSSRAGFRPATLVSHTRTLNEKLRRAYRMA